jgi:hypothetical protein
MDDTMVYVLHNRIVSLEDDIKVCNLRLDAQLRALEMLPDRIKHALPTNFKENFNHILKTNDYIDHKGGIKNLYHTLAKLRVQPLQGNPNADAEMMGIDESPAPSPRRHIPVLEEVEKPSSSERKFTRTPNISSAGDREILTSIVHSSDNSRRSSTANQPPGTAFAIVCDDHIYLIVEFHCHRSERGRI